MMQNPATLGRELSSYAFSEYGHDALLYNGIHDLETVLLSRWQPIATAPKNGKLVLLWDPRQGIRVGRLRGTNWTTVPGLWTIHPTHWMPLPEPPAEDA